MIDFEVILEKIGYPGRYQIVVCILAFWVGIPPGFFHLAPVFIAPDVDFRCKVHPLDDAEVYPNLTEADLWSITVPIVDGVNDSCRRYGYNLSDCQPPSISCVNKSAPPIDCDQGYHFDTRVFTSTINAEWDLVCERKIFVALSTSVYFLGMLCGSIVFGNLSDILGRRMTMLICAMGELVFGIATAFSPWLELFFILRFLTAMCGIGAFIAMFVYVSEISGKYRSVICTQTHTTVVMGNVLCSLFSYFIRDWRWFYFAISLTITPYFAFHFFIPESPKWHFSYGRDEIGKKIATKFAKHNNKILTERDWEDAAVRKDEVNVKKTTYTSLDLFKTKEIRRVTITCMFTWFVGSIVYYGLSLNVGALAGDIFLNNALNAVVGIPAYVIVTIMSKKFGLKTTLISMMIVQGVCITANTLLTHFANNNQSIITAAVVVALIGKTGSAGSLAVIYNFSVELFPTVIRGSAMGMGSMAARIGSIISPFIILLQDSNPWAPNAVFGALSLLAALASFTYPETVNSTMPQTIEEAEVFLKSCKHKKDDNPSGIRIQTCETKA